jgi:hypothetical protein
MRVFLATTLCVVLLGTSSAFAQGCEHSQSGNNCSGEQGHRRARSDWAGHYERHTRAQSGRHDRGQSGWRGRVEPVHTRRASQRDR